MQNVFPSKSTAFRHVVYTCYQPAAMASDELLAEKRRAYQEHLITTHWPAMNLQLFDQAIGALQYPTGTQKTSHILTLTIW